MDKTILKNDQINIESEFTLWKWVNYTKLIYSVLNRVWIKKIPSDVFLSNHNFVNMLWLYEWPSDNEAINDFSLNNWFIVEKSCNLENIEDLLIYIKQNISDIKKWDLLVWFIFDSLKVEKILIWRQNLTDNEVKEKVSLLIDNIKEEDFL